LGWSKWGPVFKGRSGRCSLLVLVLLVLPAAWRKRKLSGCRPFWIGFPTTTMTMIRREYGPVSLRAVISLDTDADHEDR
jgi:hypothetical protein